MRITLAALADYASVSIGDKLNILGVFDTIFASQFPAVHGQLALVIRAQLEYEDRNKSFEIPLRLEDEDGKRIFEGSTTLNVGDVPPGETASSNLILGMGNLPLKGPGRYSFVIGAGDDELRLPLKVVRIQQQ